jgi:hypothetical protein
VSPRIWIFDATRRAIFGDRQVALYIPQTGPWVIDVMAKPDQYTLEKGVVTQLENMQQRTALLG